MNRSALVNESLLLGPCIASDSVTTTPPPRPVVGWLMTKDG